MIKRTAALLSALGIICCTMTACKGGSNTEEEIKLPIYGAEEISYEIATAKYMDISETDGIGVTIGYPYADNLYYPAGAQLVEFLAVKGRTVNEGDVLAVLDSSELDYEISNQQTIVNTAYANSLAGGESARLQYQIEQNKLDKMLEEKDSYTIRAPYTGEITYINRVNAGDNVEGGEVCCTIAPEETVQIYVDGGDANKFRYGQDVVVKIDGVEYAGSVVMAPDIAPATASGAAAKRAIFALEDGVMDKIREESPLALSAGWATVYLTSEKKNVLAVPDSAVKTSGSISSVTIVDGEERYRLRVTIGASYGGYTEILNGIAEGDIVIADGSGMFTTDLEKSEDGNGDGAGFGFQIDKSKLKNWDGVVDEDFLAMMNIDENMLSQWGIDIESLKGITFSKEDIEAWDGKIDPKMIRQWLKNNK